MDAAARVAAVRSSSEDAQLLQRGCVIRHHPAVIRADVSISSPGDVDSAVGKQQSGTLVGGHRIERYEPITTVRAGPGHGSLNADRPAEFLRSTSNVESMQPLHNIR